MAEEGEEPKVVVKTSSTKEDVAASAAADNEPAYAADAGDAADAGAGGGGGAGLSSGAPEPEETLLVEE